METQENIYDFVIVHGSYGSPFENWFSWLFQKLEAKGFKVLVPQFVDKAASALTVAKSGQVTDANTQIEAISGATITSRAVTNGVNAAVSYFENVLKGGQ